MFKNLSSSNQSETNYSHTFNIRELILQCLAEYKASKSANLNLSAIHGSGNPTSILDPSSINELSAIVMRKLNDLRQSESKELNDRKSQKSSETPDLPLSQYEKDLSTSPHNEIESSTSDNIPADKQSKNGTKNLWSSPKYRDLLVTLLCKCRTQDRIYSEACISLSLLLYKSFL